MTTTISVAMKTIATSKLVKTKSIGWPMARLTKTSTDTMRRAGYMTPARSRATRGGGGARRIPAELKLLAPQPSHREGQSEHEQQVADDRADQRGLDDGEIVAGDQEDGDDQLGQVAEG